MGLHPAAGTSALWNRVQVRLLRAKANMQSPYRVLPILSDPAMKQSKAPSLAT